MTLDEMDELFSKHGDEYGYFERIENKLSQRQDMHAFLLLDKLAPRPGWGDMVCHAEHDEIWLDASAEDFAAAATEQDVIDIIRCGVRFDGEGFVMFA